MRFFIYLSLALTFLSADVIFDGNFAGAAEKKSDMHSDLDDGLVVCQLNSEKKIMCNCKQGTQACTDMIENSCGESGASCAGGYCSCEAKDTMLRLKRSLRDEAVGSGTVVVPSPSVPDRLRNRQKTKSPATGTLKRN
ncbi:MAG: hypothetical protein WDZ83_07470 [Rhizobiaceae bacterium]